MSTALQYAGLVPLSDSRGYLSHSATRIARRARVGVTRSAGATPSCAPVRFSAPHACSMRTCCDAAARRTEHGSAFPTVHPAAVARRNAMPVAASSRPSSRLPFSELGGVDTVDKAGPSPLTAQLKISAADADAARAAQRALAVQAMTPVIPPKQQQQAGVNSGVVHAFDWVPRRIESASPLSLALAAALLTAAAFAATLALRKTAGGRAGDEASQQRGHVPEQQTPSDARGEAPSAAPPERARRAALRPPSAAAGAKGRPTAAELLAAVRAARLSSGAYASPSSAAEARAPALLSPHRPQQPPPASPPSAAPAPAAHPHRPPPPAARRPPPPAPSSAAASSAATPSSVALPSSVASPAPSPALSALLAARSAAAIAREALPPCHVAGFGASPGVCDGGDDGGDGNGAAPGGSGGGGGGGAPWRRRQARAPASLAEAAAAAAAAAAEEARFAWHSRGATPPCTLFLSLVIDGVGGVGATSFAPTATATAGQQQRRSIPFQSSTVLAPRARAEVAAAVDAAVGVLPAGSGLGGVRLIPSSSFSSASPSPLPPFAASALVLGGDAWARHASHAATGAAAASAARAAADAAARGIAARPPAVFPRFPAPFVDENNAGASPPGGAGDGDDGAAAVAAAAAAAAGINARPAVRLVLCGVSSSPAPSRAPPQQQQQQLTQPSPPPRASSVFSSAPPPAPPAAQPPPPPPPSAVVSLQPGGGWWAVPSAGGAGLVSGVTAIAVASCGGRGGGGGGGGPRSSDGANAWADRAAAAVADAVREWHDG